MGERRKGERERALYSELRILCENVEVTNKDLGNDWWERVCDSCERVAKKRGEA